MTEREDINKLIAERDVSVDVSLERTSGQLFEHVLLSVASSLARTGQLKQAEELVLPYVKEAGLQLTAVDLLAKIYAQQDKILEAKQLWQYAKKKDPTNSHYSEAIIDCEKILLSEKKKALWKALRRIILAVTIIFLVITIILLTMYESGLIPG